MNSPKIPPVTIQLAAHERQIPLAEIGRGIYESLRDLGRDLSGDTWSCFPFCPDNRPPDWHRSWPRMRDFRDSLVTGLPQVPPTDEHECKAIKLELIADLSRQRKMFAAGAMELVGAALTEAHQVLDDFEQGLTATPSRPLTKVDMHYYGNVVIRTRIQKMLDAEVAEGNLRVSAATGEKVVALDALAEWAALRGVMVEQSTVPGFTSPLIHAHYRRLEAADNRPQSLDEPLPAESKQQNIVHRTRSRTVPMQAEIDRAIREALDPSSPASVWAALTKLAEQKEGAMIGFSSDGIQYKGKQYQDSGVPDIFTLKSLQKRMARAKDSTDPGSPGKPREDP